MLSKTQGIVISYMRYRETSIVVNVYTSEMGICSYIENGVRSAKAKHKMALFQPLTLLDLEVYHKPGKGLHRISEAKCFFPYQAIPFDIAKSSLALFLSEVLSKVLKEEEAKKVEALFAAAWGDVYDIAKSRCLKVKFNDQKPDDVGAFEPESLKDARQYDGYYSGW
jgi:DNA repair protein RecO